MSAKNLRNIKLRTACSSCTNKCCSQPYDWVYLTRDEIDQIKKASGVSEGAFVVRKQNVNTGHMFNSLNLPCIFLDEVSGNCRIYESRPLVCRLFPFYPEPLTGDATLLPAQCGTNLVFVSDEDEGWSLADYEEETVQWLRQLWKEATTGQG
ncbi:MAG: YkgJ family cysteine cluster protein [Chloracidobacterium sp.]|nr:YkgJ family cysteine cluster protein [Chloracidobacterium sp.]